MVISIKVEREMDTLSESRKSRQGGKFIDICFLVCAGSASIVLGVMSLFNEHAVLQPCY